MGCAKATVDSKGWYVVCLFLCSLALWPRGWVLLVAGIWLGSVPVHVFVPLTREVEINKRNKLFKSIRLGIPISTSGLFGYYMVRARERGANSK